VTAVTTRPAPQGDRSSRTASERNEEQRPRFVRELWDRGDQLTRALKSNGLWLTVGYLGLLFLLTRAYL
jgi:hypothetical protein